MASEGSREAALCVPQCLLRTGGACPVPLHHPTAARALLGQGQPLTAVPGGQQIPGTGPWGLPCSPESSSAPARLHKPLLSRERGTEGQKVPIPQQEPTGQVHSLVSDLFLFRCSKPGALPFPAQAVSTAPRWGQLGGATRHSREKPGELLVPLVLW